MEFNKLITNRRSVRSFTGGKIPGDAIRAMLNAGLRAPNACNLQSWHFYCICDAEKIAGLVPSVYGGEWMKNASVVIVVCTKSTRLEERFGERGIMFAIQDTAAAAENILLSAADLGYGGCWIGAFHEDNCRSYLSLPDDERPVILLPIGTYETEPALRDRKSFDEAVTFIGEPGKEEETKEETKPFELKNAYLPSAVFDDLYLGNAVFNNICLTNSKFSDINFTGSEFGGLCMNQTSFGCVDMVNARFENPDLTGASFKNCCLRKVNIENCDIDGLTIDGVNIAELIKRDS